MISGKVLKRGNVEIYYETGMPELKKDNRETPIIVYLSGYGLNLTAFSHEREHFHMLGAASVAPDNRGDGKSTLLQKAEDYTLDALVDDLEGVVNAEGLTKGSSKFTIVGHSSGAMVAQRYAAIHEEKLDALILIAASYDFMKTFARSPIRRLLLGISPVGEYFETASTMAAGIFCGSLQGEYQNFSDEKFRGITDLRHAWITMGKKSLEQAKANHAFGKALAGFNTEDDAQRINVPTLLIYGGSDFLVPPQTAYELHEMIPGARNIPPVIIPGAQHGLIFQQPERVIAAMERFLAGEIYSKQLMPFSRYSKGHE